MTILRLNLNKMTIFHHLNWKCQFIHPLSIFVREILFGQCELFFSLCYHLMQILINNNVEIIIF